MQDSVATRQIKLFTLMLGVDSKLEATVATKPDFKVLPPLDVSGSDLDVRILLIHMTCRKICVSLHLVSPSRRSSPRTRVHAPRHIYWYVILNHIISHTAADIRVGIEYLEEETI